jgi:hypothetical protein
MKEIINSISMLCATLIGGALTILSQYCFSKRQEKRERRKILVANILEILDYIESVDRAIASILNFINLPIPEYPSEEELLGIQENLESLKVLTNKCSSNWKSYKKILYTFFPKIIKDKKFSNFENILTEIDYFEKRLRTDSFIGIIPEVLRNNQEQLRYSLKSFYDALKFNEEIRKQYLFMFKK